MVILDLQWVLFVVLCAATLAIGSRVWALRRSASVSTIKTDDVSDELQRAQRASRSLISDLGHELRTPIATLLAHVARFYRAAPETIEGSGLGLALVAEILRHHGSELEMTSSVTGDTGTCARFVLRPAAATGGG